MIAARILPAPKLNFDFMPKSETSRRSAVLDWMFTLYFSPDGSARVWRTDIDDHGWMAPEPSIARRSITVTRDRSAYESYSITNLKGLRKTGPGQREY